jgi:hypothetical protein
MEPEQSEKQSIDTLVSASAFAKDHDWCQTRRSKAMRDPYQKKTTRLFQNSLNSITQLIIARLNQKFITKEKIVLRACKVSY